MARNAPVSALRPADGEATVRVQMRVRITRTEHTAFLELCESRNIPPNRVLGTWIRAALKTGKLRVR